jgi:predicted PurR-regulated permease PerM
MYSQGRYRRVAFAAVFAIICLLALLIALPFWQAIAWGVALAILANPINVRLRRRLSEGPAAGVTTIVVLAFIIVPLTLIGVAVVLEANDFVQQLKTSSASQGKDLTLSKALDDLDAQIQPYARNMGAKDFSLRESLRKSIEPLAGNAPRIANSIIHGLLTFIFSMLLLFFTLKDADKLRKPALELLPLPPEKSEAIFKGVYDTVHATFFGIVLVALLQGTLLGLAFWALGLQAPLVWGMACFVLCTIPFAGAPVLWVPSCLLLLSQGDWVRAIILALVGMFVIGLIDNVLRPIIIGSRVNLHPIAVFFAIFGGIVTLGPVGILVGPVLLSVCLGAVQVLREMAAESEEAV